MENPSYGPIFRDVASTRRHVLIDLWHRQLVICNLMMALSKYLPVFLDEGWIEIQCIATRLEENIYTTAMDEQDYFEEISREIRSIVWKTYVENERHQERLAIHFWNPQPGHSISQFDQAVETTLEQGTIIHPRLLSITQIPNHEEESSGGTENYCGMDRISNLSNDLLHTILSLLPAKEVVCTGLLSHRWRGLWASVPCLIIDENQFGAEREQQFNQFVDSILLKRCAPLEKFCLFSAGTCHASFWINLALRNNVKVIEYCETGRNTSRPCLDETILHFASRYLKVLRLGYVEIPSNAFDALNSSCPSLEDLELIQCMLGTIEISSKSLVNLLLIGCAIRTSVLICCPKLVSFTIMNPMHRCPIFEKLQSIEEAAISLDDLVHDGADEVDLEVYYCNILDSLSHAKSLELLAPFGELTFEMEMMNIPMFNNLTSLILGEWSMPSSFYPLTCFLRHSPQLQSLTLKLGMDKCEYCCALEHNAMPGGGSFTSNQLKKVEIKCIKGHKLVEKLVTMLRQNAKFIEELSIEEIEPSG
ncbi:hypothetical protein ACP70R_032789 [Stipagrostis hirtigluma subsp. patula]